jgi:hypothetical protein
MRSQSVERPRPRQDEMEAMLFAATQAVFTSMLDPAIEQVAPREWKG